MSKLTLLLFTFILISCQVKKDSGGDDYIADHRRATNVFTVKNSQTGTLKDGQTLTFTLSFPSDIIVAGSPQLDIEIGSNTRKAIYQSGDGSKNLTFTYDIVAADNDADGIRFTGIDLNGATLQFMLNEVLTNCSTSINDVHYTNLLVDNTAPTIINLTHAHSPNIYYWEDVLGFSVRFSERVNVTGAPQLALTFSTGGARLATYHSGSGTDTLTFRYNIEDDVATTGITFPASITLNGGTIRDLNGFDFTNTISAAIRSNANTLTIPLIIEGRIPKLTSVTLPANGTYGASQELDFTLVFDRNVNISGNTRLEITIGSTVRHANFYAGDGTNELTFRYIPIPGDEDANGITLNNQVIFPTPATDYISSTVASTAPYRFANIAANNNLRNPVTSGIIIAAVQPRITNITRINDSTISPRTSLPDNVWNIGQDLFLQVQFNTAIFVNNDNGSPTLEFTINGVNRTASYLSGGDGQTTLVFRYTVVEGDNSVGADIGIGTFHLNNSVIEDARETQAQVTISQTTVAQTIIDGVRPIINTVGAPADGTYSQVAPLNILNFPVEFSEPVVMVNTANSDLAITIGATSVVARATNIYSTGSILTFRYNVALNNTDDTDGIQITSPITNITNVTDDAGNTASNLSFAAPTLTDVLVDTTRPTILSVTEPAEATYVAGDSLSFTVTFSEAVTYTPTPRIPLNIGGSTRYATIVTPTTPATTALTFSYDPIGTNLLDNAITFNNLEAATRAAIIDGGRNNIGIVNLPAIGNTIAVDSRAPTLTPSLISAAGFYEVGEVIQVRLTANEDVLVTGTPILRSNLGGTNVDFEYQPTGSTQTQLIFEYTVTASDFDFDGLGSIATLTNPNDIEDLFGNNPVAALASTLTMSGIKIKPTSFLAWSAGELSDVYSGAGSFSGASEGTCAGNNCLQLNNASLTTSVASADTIYARMSVDVSSVNETIFDTFVIEDDGEIVLDGPDVGTILVNGVTINRVGGKYHLGINFGTFFRIEMNLSASITEITSANFTGQFRHLFLFSAPLTATQRTAVQTAAN